MVVDGVSAVDISLVTGEPVPVELGPGDAVLGASVNANGSLVVEATGVGADTVLARIVRMVEQAQTNRTRIQRLADRISAVFVPAAVAIALGTLFVWLATGQPASEAFTAAVAVLIVACPCALGLATPLAVMVGTGRGSQLGIIVKGGEMLEDTRQIDTVVFDKTGTVTEARMEVVDVTAPGSDPDELLILAASVEARSEHPIGRAIAAASDSRRPVSGFENHPGAGAVRDSRRSRGPGGAAGSLRPCIRAGGCRRRRGAGHGPSGGAGWPGVDSRGGDHRGRSPAGLRPDSSGRGQVFGPRPRCC